MLYCVIKDTTIIIEGSMNKEEIMYQNALNVGYVQSQVEILTQSQYDTRKASEVRPPKMPSIEERLSQTEQVLNMILLGGIKGE